MNNEDKSSSLEPLDESGLPTTGGTPEADGTSTSLESKVSQSDSNSQDQNSLKTTEQFDADYMTAVESGDMETAQLNNVLNLEGRSTKIR